MTADRSERERAAVAAAGLTPVPYMRTTPADVAGCEGRISSTTNRTIGLCHRCERFGHNGNRWTEPAAFLDGNRAWDCPNHRPLLSADQVAAVDEQAGLHVGNVPHSSAGVHPIDFGGLNVQQHTGGVMPKRVGS